jgi:hypothetical protein
LELFQKLLKPFIVLSTFNPQVIFKALYSFKLFQISEP